MGGALGATYDVHLRLIGKLIVDFLLVIIELFSVAVMLVELRANNRLEIAVLEGGGSLWSKISGRRGHPPPTICARIDIPVNALQLCR